MEESGKTAQLDTAKVFNLRVWEGIQYKLSSVLGIAVRVISEDGSIITEETNFSEFFRYLNSSEKGRGVLQIKPEELKDAEKEVKVYAGLTYLFSSTYFYGKKFNIIVGVTGKSEKPQEILKGISDTTGLKYEELLKTYESIEVIPEEKISRLSDLIVDLFNIVVELSVQEHITQSANKAKEEEIAKMAALMEASVIINSTRNLAQLLRIIMQSAEKVMQAEASSVFLIDSSSNELYFEVATGPKEEEVKKIRLKMGEGIAGWVAYTGESLLVPDASQDPRFAKRVDEKTRFITKSVICVPLKVRNQIIGVVQVLNRIGGGTFNKSEIKFLEALASQAAIAIENTNLYEHLEERAEMLNKELKDAMDKLGFEKMRVESMIKSMDDAVVAADRDGKIVMLNRVAEDIFGITAASSYGKPVADVIKDRSIIENYKVVAALKSTTKNEVKIKRGNKEHIFASVSAPILDDRGEYAGGVAVLRDITEIKELDKMKSEFLNMVSHELRTPLTPIQAYSELMLVRNVSEEKVKKYADIINKETQRLGSLIGDLLDLSRIESGKGLSLSVEEFDFQAFLSGVYETFRSASVKHKIILTMPDKSEKIKADRNKMIQVMSNLLSNAIKYSPDGGNIYITMTETQDRVYVSVRDEGLGVAKGDMDKIFEKFYRVENEKIKKIGGTGIGLPIVKYILELHNGDIEVISEEGKGSEFKFYIPKIK
ncbi:MAG: GAF domain-containing protein [Candidatus Goldbacteria bacterium]|nr:GAF domain-containing protein [Candidatus Goldiibacteriota bacterium]